MQRTRRLISLHVGEAYSHERKEAILLTGVVSCRQMEHGDCHCRDTGAIPKRTAPEQGPRVPEDRELISALWVALAGLKIRPRAGVHVAEQRRLPRVFRMRREERFGIEVSAAGMTHARDETHAFRHFAVGSFALHRPAGVVRTPFPHSYSARR